MTSEQIEAYSQVIIAKTRLNIMFMAMLGLTPSTDQCIASFIDSLSSQDLNCIENQSLLAQFKIDFEKEVTQHFVNLTKVRMFQTFGIYLASLSNLYVSTFFFYMYGADYSSLIHSNPLEMAIAWVYGKRKNV